MTFILDGLFLGTVDDACNGQRLKQKGITHILTVNAKPLSKEIIGNFSYLFVHALDMYGTDLLGRFEECIQFIEDGRTAGGVLIHCYFGISRSATLVIAYLMHKLSLSLEEATECVSKLRPQIKPNQGFLEQLGLFEAMGNRLDRTYEAYKQYRLNNLAIKMQQAQVEHLEEDHFSADPFHATNQSIEAVYKCRKCRRPLFRQNAVMSHTVGKGDAAFDWRATNTPLEKQGVACLDSIFVEPIKWMSGAILDIEGKLVCPKCSAKIGSYNWAGKQCHCGSWVTPAFHIQNAKVDKCASRNPSTFGQINPCVPGRHFKTQAVEVSGKSLNQDSKTENVTQISHTEDPLHKNVYKIAQDSDTKKYDENSRIDITTEMMSNTSLSNEEFRRMENVTEEQAH